MCAFPFASKEESAEDAGRSTEEGERNTDGRTPRLKSRASKVSSEEFPKRENGKSVR